MGTPHIKDPKSLLGYSRCHTNVILHVCHDVKKLGKYCCITLQYMNMLYLFFCWQGFKLFSNFYITENAAKQIFVHVSLYARGRVSRGHILKGVIT